MRGRLLRWYVVACHTWWQRMLWTILRNSHEGNGSVCSTRTMFDNTNIRKGNEASQFLFFQLSPKTCAFLLRRWLYSILVITARDNMHWIVLDTRILMPPNGFFTDALCVISIFAISQKNTFFSPALHWLERQRRSYFRHIRALKIRLHRQY